MAQQVIGEDRVRNTLRDTAFFAFCAGAMAGITPFAVVKENPGAFFLLFFLFIIFASLTVLSWRSIFQPRDC